MLLELHAYNEYEKKQYERGIAFGGHPRDSIVVVDADSVAFMRGYEERSDEIHFAPFGHELDFDIAMLLDVLDIRGKERSELLWQLRQLNPLLLDKLEAAWIGDEGEKMTEIPQSSIVERRPSLK